MEAGSFNNLQTCQSYSMFKEALKFNLSQPQPICKKIIFRYFWTIQIDGKTSKENWHLSLRVFINGINTSVIYQNNV